jgi:hypothetical protein
MIAKITRMRLNMSIDTDPAVPLEKGVRDAMERAPTAEREEMVQI